MFATRSSSDLLGVRSKTELHSIFPKTDLCCLANDSALPSVEFEFAAQGFLNVSKLLGASSEQQVVHAHGNNAVQFPLLVTTQKLARVSPCATRPHCSKRSCATRNTHGCVSVQWFQLHVRQMSTAQHCWDVCGWLDVSVSVFSLPWRSAVCTFATAVGQCSVAAIVSSVCLTCRGAVGEFVFRRPANSLGRESPEARNVLLSLAAHLLPCAIPKMKR